MDILLRSIFGILEGIVLTYAILRTANISKNRATYLFTSSATVLIMFFLTNNLGALMYYPVVAVMMILLGEIDLKNSIGISAFYFVVGLISNILVVAISDKIGVDMSKFSVSMAMAVLLVELLLCFILNRRKVYDYILGSRKEK